MNIASLFKSGFWFGRLIWIRGSGSTKEGDRVDQLLSGCGIQSPEVFRLTALQFVDVFSRGFNRELLNRYEVLMVSEFENMSGMNAANFLKCIQSFCDFKSGHSLQLILLSERCVSAELDQFRQFNPVEVIMGDEADDPGEMNERVHSLLELAMRLTQVSVHRISERAAVFLETFLTEEGDEDTFLLLIRSLPRSNRHELRLKDLTPPVLVDFAQKEPFEAPCY